MSDLRLTAATFAHGTSLKLAFVALGAVDLLLTLYALNAGYVELKAQRRTNMAKEEPEEKTEDAAGKAEPKKAMKTDVSNLLGDDDDLMDLFGDADEVNEELTALTAGLEDVAIGDLLAQVRDIRGVLGKR